LNVFVVLLDTASDLPIANKDPAPPVICRLPVPLKLKIPIEPALAPIRTPVVVAAAVATVPPLRL
jgi:hypothetical protein